MKNDGVPTRPWWRRPRLQYAGAFALYILLASLFIHDWDGFVFQQSSRDLLDGRSPYEVAEDGPYYSFLNIQDEHPQWYAYPPLPLLIMSLAYLPEVLFNVPSPLERVLIKLPMVFGTLGLAAVGTLWARHLGSDERTVDRVRALLLFNPFLILIGPVWGMTDHAMVALFLWGVLQYQRGHPGHAGILVALSILVKPFPLLLAVPVAAYLVHGHGWRPLGVAAATGSATVAAICIPFIASTPYGFVRQVILFHVARDTQGWSIWRLLPADTSSAPVAALSLAMVAGSLLVISLIAPRLKGKEAPLFLFLVTAVQVLFWFRIVNDQYLVMIVAPLLILYGAGALSHLWARRAAVAFPAVCAIVTIIEGFHFVTFIPPDIALPVFGKSVDVVAYQIRQQFTGWPDLTPPSGLLVAVFVSVIVANLYLSAKAVRRWLPGLRPPIATRRETHASATGAFASLAVLLIASFPVGVPGPTAVPEAPAEDGSPLVAAFYYLWWHNPAHDPAVQYGNWLPVSQHPAMGYYTNTRGVAREHVRMMVENGIDVAIVSFHSSELERYNVFREEAKAQGLLVAPLIELNQIYDRPEHHPIGPDDKRVPYASYRTDEATRQAIVDYVLELRETLADEAPTYTVDGRPVVFFYDSYVSGISYDAPSRRALSRTLLDTFPIDELRTVFADPTLAPTPEALESHYPWPGEPPDPDLSPMNAFYEGRTTSTADGPGAPQINQSAYWRQAHLAAHKVFWEDIRRDVEREVGPLFLVSGDAFNERAGFEAGTVKALAGYSAFDGSFIYSPSFLWGVQPRTKNGTAELGYDELFESWENRNIWLTTTARGAGSFSAYGIAPAYDDTVNRPEIGFVIPAYPGGPSTYDRMWTSAIEHRPDLVVVATFNEFFEGSSIEPSREYGEAFLNQTLSYREKLRVAPQPSSDVVVIVHEQTSRTHPLYSEADRPHLWGLRLGAAAERAFVDSRIHTIDGTATEPARIDRPDFVLIDGGRDGYGPGSVSDAVLENIESWIRQGVPTLILGREVAQPLRDIVPPSCRDNPMLPLGHSVVPDSVRDLDDELDAADTLTARPGSGVMAFLERSGTRYAAGYECEAATVAFLNIKPWGPKQDWGAVRPEDPVCVAVLGRALAPSVAVDPSLQTSCTLPS